MRNRLHALCPYFAMFPEEFVEEHVRQFTSEGDYVYDPFSGRGTTLLQSLLMKRQAVATDINPVAYCLSAAKAHVPSLEHVIREVNRLDQRYRDHGKSQLEEQRHSLPPFFGRAFHYSTLEQLLFLRGTLNWRRNHVHRFIAALTLGILHGEMGRSRRYLSNQMPRTISPKPAYSLHYWREHRLWPRKKDVFSRLRAECRFRLSDDLPSSRGSVVMSDVREAGKKLRALTGKIAAIITSPPYFDVTSSEEDQWLRLWFLGNEPHPTYGKISSDDRYGRRDGYWNFLAEAWAGIAPLVRPDAVLVCRLGGTGMQQSEITGGLTTSLKRAFPDAHLISHPKRTQLRRRQTPAFRPGSLGCRFEVDHIFRLGSAVTPA